MSIAAIKELIKNGDIPQASERLREILAKTPEDAAARMLYGTCCQLMGDSATFGRIYRDLAPEMEPRVTRGERSELVSMWLKYAAMFAMIIAIGLHSNNAYASDVVGDNTEEVAPRKKIKRSRKAAQEAERIIVAIGNFENESGAPDSVFETICVCVEECVVGARKYKVVEREQIKAAMSEQMLVASGVTDGEASEALKAGKMKAASYVIYGNILYCGKDKSGGSSGGVASSVVESKVEILIKITDGETGKILTQKSAIGYGTDRAMATSEYSTFTGRGMRDAIDEACHMAADTLRDVAYPAKIITANDEEAIINMTEEEVKEGDVFDVVDAKDLGTDEDTGAWLGFGGKTIGRVKVESTGPQTSSAEPTKGKKGKMIDLEELDTDEHMYILRRVSKKDLRRERPPACTRYLGPSYQFSEPCF